MIICWMKTRYQLGQKKFNYNQWPWTQSTEAYVLTGLKGVNPCISNGGLCAEKIALPEVHFQNKLLA